MNIEVFNRKTNKIQIEKVYGEKLLHFIYNGSFFSKLILFFTSRFTLFSFFYGIWQKSFFSKKKIKPFIEKFEIDSSEFEKKIEDFSSFNDFFIRKLKREKRPIDQDENHIILPADARYLIFPNVNKSFFVKEKKFDLFSFLKDENLAKQYEKGSLVLARLNPTDYHRFHFPIDCYPSTPKLINGYLYSVNPIAIKKNIKIFYENKRVLTSLKTKDFGNILFVAVGATNVGSIHLTFTKNNHYRKGEEMGYFSFGGSSIVLLFEKEIAFEEDLIQNSLKGLETKCSFGEILGSKIFN